MALEHVQVGPVRLALRASGPADGPPLLLLHATGDTSLDWEVVRPLLGPRRIIAPDLRGHGDSDWPGDYSVELMRDDILILLDELGLDQVDLIGHSLGGVIAYLVAAALPGRVDHLVLEDIPSPRPRDPSPPIRPEGELPYDWDLVPAVRSQIDDPPREWLEALPRVRARTLVVAGGPPSPIPQERVRETAQLIAGAELVEIPVGHLVHAAAPERFAAVVGAFLADQ